MSSCKVELRMRNKLGAWNGFDHIDIEYVSRFQALFLEKSKILHTTLYGTMICKVKIKLYGDF